MVTLETHLELVSLAHGNVWTSLQYCFKPLTHLLQRYAGWLSHAVPFGIHYVEGDTMTLEMGILINLVDLLSFSYIEFQMFGAKVQGAWSSG